jgi:hypothetical protein
MRKFVMDQRRSRKGPEPKGARYRETLQTTGCYMDRVVIVPREFAPMPKPPHERLNSDGHQNAFLEAWRNLSFRSGACIATQTRARSIASRQSLQTRVREHAGRSALSSSFR